MFRVKVHTVRVFALNTLIFAAVFCTKIRLSVDTFQIIQTHIQESGSRACSDYTEVSKDHLSLPVGFERLPKPWSRKEAKVIRSRSVTEGMYKMFSLTVPGLNGDTIGNVIETFAQRGCLCFPYGGSVRDQFLNRAPKDLDMEVSCSREEALRICQEKWGKRDNCKSPFNIVHIGSQTAQDGATRNIDSGNWVEMFFADQIYLEYTTNSLAYNPHGDNLVIDITGNGVVDTCNRDIRIPVEREKWDQWRDTRHNKKLYRFWKLRVKGYSAINRKTHKYIVDSTKKAIIEDPKSFMKFYCSLAMKGMVITEEFEVKCLVKNCERTIKSVEQYNSQFRQDLGEFWDSVATPIIININRICC